MHREDIFMFMIVIFVMAMVVGSAIFNAWLRYRKETERAGNKGFEDLAERLGRIEQRLIKIEQRTANLETIVLEAEKVKAFREL